MKTKTEEFIVIQSPKTIAALNLLLTLSEFPKLSRRSALRVRNAIREGVGDADFIRRMKQRGFQIATLTENQVKVARHG